MPEWTRDTWAREQLQRSAKKVREAPSGSRNDELFRQAATMADYVDAGAVSEGEARAALEAAAVQAGLSGVEVRRTLDSAIGRGDGSKAWWPTSRGDAPPKAIRWGGKTLRVVSTGKGSGLPSVPIEGAPVLRLTWYDATTETQGGVVQWTWADLAQAVADPVTDPERLPLWAVHEIEGDSRAQIPDGLLADGRERFRAPAVVAVHALILDYDDDEDFSEENVRAWWGDVQYVAHTTRHHMTAKDKKPAIPRGRVIVALSRSITPDELEQLAAWVQSAHVGAPAEKELKTAARAYFVPVQTDEYWHIVNLNGRALDVDSCLRPAAPDEEATNAWGLLEVDDEGHPRRTPTNLDIVLEHDARWRGKIQRCEFTGRVLVDGHPLTDEAETEIGLTIGRVYDLHYPEERIHRSVCAVAARHPTHPVREYLEGLTWDGVERIDHWLQDYVGCADDTGLTGKMGRFFLIAAVARVMQPGCQVHTVLVLQGKQGVGKSSAFRVLCGRQWFSDTGLDIRNKDAFQALRGRLIVEWGELDSLKRSEITAVKNFVTSAVDTYRPSYGRNVIEVPRQCVFVGTTNESVFLNDPTGARRFWVVETRDEVRLDRLEADRDQLWAEAVRAYKAGERWHLTAEEDARREADAGKYQHSDPWQEAVAAWLTRNTGPCTASDVLLGALEKRPGDITRADEMRVATLMQALGRVRRRSLEAGSRCWRWVRP